MNDELTQGRRIPSFEEWESSETHIRWERGLAILAGIIGVALTFFLLYALLPLSPAEEETQLTGAQAPAPAQVQVAPAVAAEPAMPAATPAPAGDAKLSATSRAFPNVRRGPSTDQPILTNLRQGQRVDLTGRSPDGLWLQIIVPDSPRDRAWVSTDMLDVAGDVRTLPDVR